ncbi:hypothetical protein NFHSH190041_01770 [Shewanella sp. NFH-SH190041]|uniref:flagellar biosynthesis anti-sigma factor FlgM n=1 Tax=Shewanella sp. NFH-SH190041 TaxID=2950245 RepID=UPI0021C30C2C|nr:flagellar biosynthesis anti-sigma factor FlgM [Shewanella sp. NFH-SH190041]BDM62725.1 hypothetical protein NFHSH190041_01770 [Shewanella sp. NFH-SH190041]
MEIRKMTVPVALVNGTKGTPVQAQTQKQNNTTKHGTAASEQSVSHDWHMLEQAHDDLKQTSDFDAEKVAAIRQSLRDGSFDLDIGAISQAMLRQHG